MQTPLEKLQEQLELEFKEYSHTFYKDNFEENEQYQVLTEDYYGYVQRNNMDSIDIKWLMDLSLLHFEYSIYAKVNKDDNELAHTHLSLATQYGYLSLEYGSQCCGCFQDKNPFIIMNKAVFMMSNLLLTYQIDRFNSIGNHLIDSLNGKSCIIKKGYQKATISWFVLKLYSLYADKEITLHTLLQPKETFPYDEVLKHWDTDNLNDVTKFVELLCDAHIAQAKIDYAIHNKERLSDDTRDMLGLAYKELFLVSMYQIPYEILTWLKLRELKGLPNPTEFSHPLMNTPLAKMFLELKTPLAKPTELPYAKELLAKLKEACPQIEVEA